ncbi:MAG: L,D-transpeptidase family protein [Candidatus Saccharimonadales bacterium]
MAKAAHEHPEGQERAAAEQIPAEVEVVPQAAHIPDASAELDQSHQHEEGQSVKANTHTRKRTKVKADHAFAGSLKQKRWPKITGLAVGVMALITLVVSGVLSQYFKDKTLPNVTVASVASSVKTRAELKGQLEQQLKDFSLKLQTGEKTLEPKAQEIGLKVDIDQTIDRALQAKRQRGLLAKLAFWKSEDVPAVVAINDTLLGQYLETHLPELSKAPQDAQLQFNSDSSNFAITEQADGQGADAKKLKLQIQNTASQLQTATLTVATAAKAPTITKAKLEPLLADANTLVSRRVTLAGLGYNYQARPSDIASWVTPTPQEDGSIKLIIDVAKIQSYVDGIGKKISQAPVDKKVLKDETTGAEVVLQSGRDGTELADKNVLADAIAQSLKAKQDSAQTMNIKVAAYQTVNMNAYDKWIEVDLSEQRTTAYEKATPIKNFLIASGMRGHETPVGEYAIWLRVRSQTMQGGSKADGSYYNIPNVEWVSYFYQDYALHGAWWREKFGAPASHGCVNMTNADAQWVFEWAPIGTKVIVHA